MSLLWTDGDWTTASAISGIRRLCPIPGDTIPYIIEQDFVQFSANYSPLAIGAAHATETGYRLAEESQHEALPAGVTKWTRKYVKKPAQWDDFKTTAYPFIGFYGSYGPNELIPTGRARQAFTVQSRIQHDYFVVAASGGDATSVSSIPIIQAQKYRIVYDGYFMDVDFLGDNPPFSTATVPDRSTYQGWINNAESYKWAAGTIAYDWQHSPAPPDASAITLGTNPGQICIADSEINLWYGDIYERITQFVLAQ